MATDRSYRLPTWFLAASLAFSLVSVVVLALALRARMKAHWPW